MRVKADIAHFYVSHRAQTTNSAAAFSEDSAVAKSTERASQIDSANTSRSLIVQHANFTYMTGNQMQSTAAELYEAGTINLT